MNMKLLRLAPAVMAMMLAVPAATQVSSSADGMLMRIKWTKGKSYSYAMSASFSAPQMKEPMTTRSTIGMKVESVSGGTATLAVTGTGMDFSGMGPGGNRTVGKDTTQKITVTNQGKVSQAGGAAQFVVLPVKRIKPGESWTTEQTVSGPTGPLKTKTTYRLVGTATLAGVKVAELNVGLSGSGPGVTNSGHGKVFINMADGLVQQTSIKQSIRITNPESDTPMTVGNDLALKRVTG